MNNKWFVVLGVALILVAVMALGYSYSIAASARTPGGDAISVVASNQQQGVWVTGSGMVSVTPDILTLQVGVSAQEATVAKAQSEAASAMTSVMQALTTGGVAEKDIQTQYFNVQQVTKYDPQTQQQVVIGY